MRATLSLAFTLAGVAILSPPSYAQFVKGNEAVAGGKVETPPILASMGKPCAATAMCHAGAWHMVETTSGLVECTEPSARPTTCRLSTYGTQRLARLWVVKKGTAWLWCQYPDLASKCVGMSAKPPANLPYDAVQ
jgi:hypothetical protein